MRTLARWFVFLSLRIMANTTRTNLPSVIASDPTLAAAVVELLATRRGQPLGYRSTVPPANSSDREVEELANDQLASPVNSVNNVNIVNNWEDPAPDDDDNVSEGYETALGSEDGGKSGVKSGKKSGTIREDKWEAGHRQPYP